MHGQRRRLGEVTMPTIGVEATSEWAQSDGHRRNVPPGNDTLGLAIVSGASPRNRSGYEMIDPHSSRSILATIAGEVNGNIYQTCGTAIEKIGPSDGGMSGRGRPIAFCADTNTASILCDALNTSVQPMDWAGGVPETIYDSTVLTRAGLI